MTFALSHWMQISFLAFAQELSLIPPAADQDLYSVVVCSQQGQFWASASNALAIPTTVVDKRISFGVFLY